MKAQRLLLLLLAATTLFSSCTKRYYNETIVEGTQLKHYMYDIKYQDWDKIEVLDDGFILSVQLNVPNITASVVQNGNIMVSRQLTGDNNQTYWTPLPVVRAEAENFGTDNVILYSTYLDYEWTEGKVFIYFTATDFYVDPDRQYWPNMVLKVTVME